LVVHVFINGCYSNSIHDDMMMIMVVVVVFSCSIISPCLWN
jgi:hypothetical protein